MNSPLSYLIDSARERVLVTYHRTADFEEWSATMTQIFADPAFRQDYGVLLDKSAVPTPAETVCMKKAVTFIDQKIREGCTGRWAFVAASLGNFGLGRMAEQLTEFEGAIRAFKSMEAAEAWLAHGDGVGQQQQQRAAQR